MTSRDNLQSAEDIYTQLCAKLGQAGDDGSSPWGFSSSNKKPAEDNWDSVDKVADKFWSNRCFRYPHDLFDEFADKIVQFIRINDNFSVLFSELERSAEVVVRVVPARTVDLRVMQATNGEFLVCVDEGLIDVLITLTKVALWQRVPAEFTPNRKRAATGGFNFTKTLSADLVDRVVRSYLGVIRISGGVGLPLDPALPPAIEVAATTIATRALNFLVCHEIIHAVAGHLTDAKSRFRQPLEGYGSVGRRDEVEADHGAVKLLTGLMLEDLKASQDDGVGLRGVISLIGIAVALKVSSLLQRVCIAIEPGTHVPDDNRIELVQRMIDMAIGEGMAARSFDEFAEIDRWHAMVMSTEWSPRAAHHLLNSLPMGGVLDFSLKYIDVPDTPNEEDDFLLSYLITCAEDDFRQRTLSPFSLFVRIGSQLFGDVLDHLDPAAREHVVDYTPRRMPVPLGEPNTSETIEVRARMLACAIAGQHWYYKVFLTGWVRMHGIALDGDGFSASDPSAEALIEAIVTRGLTYAELRNFPPSIAPPVVRQHVAHLIDIKRRGQEPYFAVDESIIEMIAAPLGMSPTAN